MSADLVLVGRCLQGDAAAWQELLTRYRATVLNSALHMTRNSCAAEEIASAVWADLYGVSPQARSSKLVHYSGRGSLEGWLRTLVAQAYANRYRTERRFIQLDSEERVAASRQEVAESADARLEHALDRALAELSSKQRLVLAAHYLDGRTFAEIGRMTGAHESSVSRQSSKAVEFVRKRTAHYLRQSGMSLAEAREAMGADVRAISLDVRRRLQAVKNTP